MPRRHSAAFAAAIRERHASASYARAPLLLYSACHYCRARQRHDAASAITARRRADYGYKRRRQLIAC
jgi:hypothetical protein